MALPLSPPPSRSSSQHSRYKAPINSTIFKSQPGALGNPRSSCGKVPDVADLSKRPSLSVQSQTLPPISFLQDPSAQSGDSTDPCSFFSPCSSDGEEDDAPRVAGKAIGGEKGRRGHFQQLWETMDLTAYRPEPAKPEPLQQIDDGQKTIRQKDARRPSLGSSTFGCHPSKENLHVARTAAPRTRKDSTPKKGPPARRNTDMSALLAHDSEILAAQSRIYQSRLAFKATEGTERLGELQQRLAENERPFLNELSRLYSSTLQMVIQPAVTESPEVASARRVRDRLMVQTQKAHLKKVPSGSIRTMHEKLAAAEEHVRELEAEARKGPTQAALDRRIMAELEAVERRARGEIGIIESIRRKLWQKQACEHDQPDRGSPTSESESARSYFSDDDDDEDEEGEDEEVIEQQAVQEAQEPAKIYDDILPFASVLTTEHVSLQRMPAGSVLKTVSVKGPAIPGVQVEGERPDTPRLTPLPPLSADEELYLAAVSRSPSPRITSKNEGTAKTNLTWRKSSLLEPPLSGREMSFGGSASGSAAVELMPGYERTNVRRLRGLPQYDGSQDHNMEEYMQRGVEALILERGVTGGRSVVQGIQMPMI